MGDPRRITQEWAEVEYSPPEPGPRRITQLYAEVEYLAVPDEDQTQIRGHDQIQPWSITSDRLSQEVAGAGLRGGGPEGPLWVDTGIYPSPDARGQMLASDAAFTWTALSLGAAATVLRSDGTDPAWVNPALYVPVSPVARGDILAANATPAWSVLTLGAANEVIQSDGTDPVWVDPAGALPIPPGAQGQAIVSDAVPAWTASLTPTWLGAHAFSAGLSVAAAQIITMGDEAYIGAGVADVRIKFDAGNDIAMLGGYVGVGLDPPAYQLDVYHATDDIIGHFKSADDLASLMLEDNDAVVYVHAKDGYMSLGGQNTLHAGNLNIATATGFAGLGTVAPAAMFQVEDLTVDTVSEYWGTRFYWTKTAGATANNDHLWGFHGALKYNQGGATIGDMTGWYWETELTDGGVGDAGVARDFTGMHQIATLTGAAGKVWGDAYGSRVFLNQIATNEVVGDVFVMHIWGDIDGTVGGTTYMLYLDEDTGIDYGIYQDGSADNYFGGNVGIGAVPTTARHLYVYDNAIDTTATYHGAELYHQKTLGASDHNDHFWGLATEMAVNQAAGVVGHIIGIDGYSRLTLGTVGTVAAARYLIALQGVAVQEGGTVYGDLYGISAAAVMNGGVLEDDAGYGHAYGIFINTNLNAGTVDGNAYGLYAIVDDDISVGGTVYMIYLDEKTGIDYGIYQNGTADNYFGGDVGIGTNAPFGPLHTATSVGGGLFATTDDVDAGGTTIIPNGAGDVTSGVTVVYRLLESAGGTDWGIVGVDNGAAVDLYDDGTDVCTLTVNADGSVTVARSAGAATFDISMYLVWI